MSAFNFSLTVLNLGNFWRTVYLIKHYTTQPNIYWINNISIFVYYETNNNPLKKVLQFFNNYAPSISHTVVIVDVIITCTSFFSVKIKKRIMKWNKTKAVISAFPTFVTNLKLWHWQPPISDGWHNSTTLIDVCEVNMDDWITQKYYRDLTDVNKPFCSS